MSSFVKTLSKKNQTEEKKTVKYGTFFGVFLPSALSIFGVIMYMRLGMILGKIGLVATLSIISFSSLITFITALSISAIATNMRVDKGGAYYIISRSLGIDFGAAIGIPIYLAQAIGIAFYVLGFSESLHATFPSLDENSIRLASLFGLGILGFFSTNIVLKTQLLIFLTLIASWISLGLGETITADAVVSTGSKLGYWAAFAIFFPAVTGILSGVSMSGELKNPRKALPVGTIAAVLAGLVVYILLAVLLWIRVPQGMLATDNLICEHLAKYQSLVIVGIWGATLSSALGSILGAPRTLQALAEDGILFKFLGKEHGKKQEPRVAFLFTLVLASLFLLMGNIDLIAPILTMFFLISYCMLNIVAGLENFIHNPSWRPSFSVPAIVSFSGALLCFLAMLMINAGATIVSIFIVLLIYFFRGKKLSSTWDNICFAIMMQFTKSTVYRLTNSGFGARCWRPHLLVFSSTMSIPSTLLSFTQKLTNGNSFISFFNVIDEKTPCNCNTVKKSILSTLKKCKMQAIVEVQQTEDALEACKRLILSHGLGPLTHNTVLLSHTDQAHEFNPEIIKSAYKMGKNALVLKSNGADLPKVAQIDIWWDSENRKTSELILVLAHMFQSTLGVKKSHITLKSVVKSETAREQRLQYFMDFFSNSRFHVDFKVYVATEEEVSKTIGYFSADADLAFVHLPNYTDETQDYKHIYVQTMRNLKPLKNAIFVMAAEPVNFQEIFK